MFSKKKDPKGKPKIVKISLSFSNDDFLLIIPLLFNPGNWSSFSKLFSWIFLLEAMRQQKRELSKTQRQLTRDQTALERQEKQLVKSIGIFGKYHNSLCLSPQILHEHCFQFLLGLTMVPKENKTMLMQNLGETNKDYYGIFWNGLLTVAQRNSKEIEHF